MSEEAAKAADKRANQAEEDVNAKNGQMEELYNEIDSMSEALAKMEKEREEQ